MKFDDDDGDRRLGVLTASLNPHRGIAATRGSDLVGIAGFHHDGKSLTSGMSFSMLRRVLGTPGAIRAVLVLMLFERRTKPGELLMDGIVVKEDHRGEGIGSGLFMELEAFARGNEYTSIHLDVVDTNPGARRLYERLGFVPIRTERTPYLKNVMGFSASTTMVKSL